MLRDREVTMGCQPHCVFVRHWSLSLRRLVAPGFTEGCRLAFIDLCWLSALHPIYNWQHVDDNVARVLESSRVAALVMERS
jgi:hypothetical protein